MTNDAEQTLILAAREGKTDTIKAIIENGYEVNSYNSNNRTVLLEVVWHSLGNEDYHEVVEWLIKNGADVNLEDKNDGITCLMLAAEYGDYALTKILLDAGADVNAKAINKSNALIYVQILPEAIEVATLLINKGADVNCQDDLGRTPLHYAVFAGHTEFIQLLLKSNANPDIKDDAGTTPLMHAYFKNKEIIFSLIEKITDINIKDNKNKNALSYAIEHEDEDFALLLIKHGAIEHFN